MKVLVVEDTKTLAKTLADMVYSINISSDIAYTGEDAFKYLDSNQYDAIILDLILPDISGFDVLQIIRSENNSTPVLILSARNKVQDRVKGLNSGANYYLTKPFATKELLARIRALTRRQTGDIDGLLHFGDITLNTHTLTLSCNENSVKLSEKEFHILEYLIANQGQILTREQLALKIWGYDSEAEYNNVEVYISFTRRKLRFVNAKTEIKAMRGIGYELTDQNV